MKRKILIVGGYGAVGSSIAERLMKVYPHQIIIAGRSFSKAQAKAEEFQNKVIPQQLDVNNLKDFSVLNEVELVIMCLDQQNTDFVEYCISKGISYIDISADYQNLQEIEKLHCLAEQNNSTVVLSVGLAPGITNLLAQYVVSQMQNVESIDIFVLLGLGEKHGDHAYRWTFDNVDSNYTLKIHDEEKTLKSFTQPLKTNLSGNRNFYLFNFSDQHVLLNTLDVTKVQTRMAFDVEWFTELTAFLRKLRITRLFRNKKVQDFAIQSFKNFPMGTDVFGVKVIAKDQNGNSKSVIVKGNNEGRITASVAAEIAVLVLDENLPKGVFHSHQLVKDIPVFLNKLKNYDSGFQLNL
ncbi:saccharopine dehydrogenase family protein [Chryseobacterium balustinum]|uniref:Saccharopine dehydrogenase, NADP-dependent n=1 Tax=Chryseobacterium balustinum TaxID=246 RepID=A0ABY1LEN1_9FLAO|nr:saccharopine dehydrogenase NADP-binding domain-containing protein [Chryseobacterium balustinum]AZB29946.1 saccharopine dehydrogenase [Chryseobacterium balustinum]SKB96734.1 Saccharopine dehydrogenase, NADP-dependent [Chryseobacterium balustinum]